MNYNFIITRVRVTMEGVTELEIILYFHTMIEQNEKKKKNNKNNRYFNDKVYYYLFVIYVNLTYVKKNYFGKKSGTKILFFQLSKICHGAYKIFTFRVIIYNVPVIIYV